MGMITILDQGYEHSGRMLQWAKKNCPSYITNDAVAIVTADLTDTTYKRIFYFGNDRDAAIFALRWS